MSWYYLDTEGNTQGPVTSTFILCKYHYKTREITSATHVWNVECGVKEWSELENVYNIIVNDTIDAIQSGIVSKRILSIMMNPYDIYIYKRNKLPNSSLPIGKAKVEIEYKGYLANTMLENAANTQELQHFIQNRESIQLGIKKNAYGLEMALYKIGEGEECLVYIPWRLAYGEKGAGDLIPPKTDILFILTMHRIQQQGATWQVIRFDKWSKMKSKWNTQKKTANMLYNKDKDKNNVKLKQSRIVTTNPKGESPSVSAKLNDDEKQENEANQNQTNVRNRWSSNGKKNANKTNVADRWSHNANCDSFSSKPMARHCRPKTSKKSNSFSPDLPNEEEKSIENILNNNVSYPQSQAQPPPANMKHNVIIAWDRWLREQQMPQLLVSKLSDGGIASWDELHAIEEDVDEVAKELRLTALQKIKLKAVLRKLPPIYDLPAIQTEIKPPPLPPLPPPPNPMEMEELKQEEVDGDDPRYLKAQIALLKAENCRLNELCDENGTKQQVMESWDNLYTKDIELQSLQNKLDEECKKCQDKQIECEKLWKLLELKQTEKCMDLCEELYNNYCGSINALINKLQTESKCVLDDIAMSAIDGIKESMNKNGEILQKEMQKKEIKLDESVEKYKQIKLMEADVNDKEMSMDMILRVDDCEGLMKKRQLIRMWTGIKLNKLLNSINNEKCSILSSICDLCLDNKYNEIFYKHFIQEMTINFYDCKLIKTQFIQNNSDILCKNGEKIIFDIPLTSKLLSIVRNVQSEINLVYDVLCLDKFIKNMNKFEADIIYNDALTFSSVIGINLTNSKVIQNIIKSAKKTSIYDEQEKDNENIEDNLKKSAKIFVDNLTYLIVTGYAMLIIKACNDQIDYIQCLTHLCLAHPIHLTQNNNIVNKENLNKILQNIQTDQLKEIINDYFINFGTVPFVEKIINDAKNN